MSPPENFLTGFNETGKEQITITKFSQQSSEDNIIFGLFCCCVDLCMCQTKSNNNSNRVHTTFNMWVHG